MRLNFLQAIAKTVLLTIASAVLHLTLLDAVFILVSTDVIQSLISKQLDA